MKDVPLTYDIISILAISSFFIPIVLVFVKKIFSNQTIIWFATYWLLQGIINLLYIDGFPISGEFLETIQRVFNLIDAPVMMFILFLTVPINAIKRSLGKMLPAFLTTSIFLSIYTHFNPFIESVIVGVGLFIILIYMIWIIIHNLGRAQMDQTTYLFQFVCYALLFEYGVSVITFIFSYLIRNANSLSDSLLIYHLSIIISIALVIYGFLTCQRLNKSSIKPSSGKEWESEIRYL